MLKLACFKQLSTNNTHMLFYIIVFSCVFLKSEIMLQFCILKGSLFHRFGAAVQKTPSPKDL